MGHASPRQGDILHSVSVGVRRTWGSRGGRSRAAADLVELHQSVRRAALIALIAFTCFALSDVYLATVVHPAARLGRMLVGRAAGVVVLGALYGWARGEARSARALVAAASAGFALSVA